MTIRRDLDQLCRFQLIERSYGKASIADRGKATIPFEMRQTTNLENSAAALTITTPNRAPSLSSEEFPDMNLEGMKNIGINIGIPKKTNEGYYIVPILTKPSSFILKARPYLSSMTALALSNVVNTGSLNSSQK